MLDSARKHWASTVTFASSLRAVGFINVSRGCRGNGPCNGSDALILMGLVGCDFFPSGGGVNSASVIFTRFSDDLASASASAFLLAERDLNCFCLGGIMDCIVLWC